MRAAALDARFTEHAARFMEYESVVLEFVRLIVQQLEQSCDDSAAQMAELRALADRFPDSEGIDSALRYGLAAAAERCDLDGPSR